MSSAGVEVFDSLHRRIYDIQLKSVETPLVSFELVYGNVSGKQAICIHIADAKRESFLVHSPHDSQSRLVIAQSYRGIKFGLNAFRIKKGFCNAIHIKKGFCFRIVRGHNERAVKTRLYVCVCNF